MFYNLWNLPDHLRVLAGPYIKLFPCSVFSSSSPLMCSCLPAFPMVYVMCVCVHVNGYMHTRGQPWLLFFRRSCLPCLLSQALSLAHCSLRRQGRPVSKPQDLHGSPRVGPSHGSWCSCLHCEHYWSSPPWQSSLNVHLKVCSDELGASQQWGWCLILSEGLGSIFIAKGLTTPLTMHPSPKLC